jgi:hypothetical protein
MRLDDRVAVVLGALVLVGSFVLDPHTHWPTPGGTAPPEITREWDDTGLIDPQAGVPAVTTAAPVTGAAPWVAAEFTRSGRITLTGQLPSSAAHERLLTVARQLYGFDRVVDAVLVERKTRQAAWLETDTLFMPLANFGQRIARLEGDVLTLEGELPSDAARLEADAEAQAAVGDGIRVENRIRVVAPGGGNR